MRRRQAQQHDATAVRVVRLDRALHAGPRAGIAARFQLPPVRLHAQIIEPLHHRRHGVGADRTGARRDDLDEQLVPRRAHRVLQPQQLALLAFAQVGGVRGVVMHEAFDDVVHGPCPQLAGDVRTAFERERDRAGHFDRATDPVRQVGGRLERALSVEPVEQDAEAAIALREAVHGAQCQRLERVDARGVGAEARAQVLELAAMVDGEHRQLVPAAAAGGRAVHMFQPRVVAQPERPIRRREERLQFRPRRHRRCAAVARHDQCTTRVAPAAAGRQRLVAQPAAQEAGHERVAGAEHVEDVDGEPGADHAVVERRRDRPVERDAAQRAALADEQRAGGFADRAQRRERVGRAAEDVQFLLGADDEVAKRQDLLEPAGDFRIGDEAVLAAIAPGQTPQHRPVVDVEQHPAAGAAHELAGAPRHLEHAGLRQVRAVHQHRARLTSTSRSAMSAQSWR